MNKMTDDQREYLVSVMGEDTVQKMEEATGTLEEELESLYAFKNLTEAKQQEQEEEETQEEEEEDMAGKEKEVEETSTEEKEVPEYEVIRNQIVKDLGITELTAVLQEMGERLKALDTLAERVGELEKIGAEVKELRKDQEEKVAEQFEPPRWRAAMEKGHVASQSEDSEIEGKQAKEMLKDAPKGDNALDPDNPMDMMLNKHLNRSGI